MMAKKDVSFLAFEGENWEKLAKNKRRRRHKRRKNL
jgi:hypothetical protein